MKKVKAKEMVVRNLADLTQIVNWNADSLERQINRIAKNSRRITILSGIVVGFIIFSAYQQQKLDDQVYNLSVRVKNWSRVKESNQTNVRFLDGFDAEWKAWHHRDLSQVYHQEK